MYGGGDLLFEKKKKKVILRIFLLEQKQFLLLFKLKIGIIVCTVHFVQSCLPIFMKESIIRGGNSIGLHRVFIQNQVCNIHTNLRIHHIQRNN